MTINQVSEKAGVLIEALPYIREFYGKTVVIKYGGSAMTSPDLKKAVALDVVLMKYIGINPVIVHGGGPEIDEMLKKLGKKPVRVGGLRVTDAETMEVVEMVLIGKVNKEIVSLINVSGGKAVGLCGKDGNLIVAKKRPAGTAIDEVTGKPVQVDLGLVGDVETINADIVNILSREGCIPVISSVATGPCGETYNVNADHVAGALAGALNAEKIIMLTDTEGVYENPRDRSSLIAVLSIEKASQMIGGGTIEGGMIPKMEACIQALTNGVRRAHIVDGRSPHSMLLEVFTDKGTGTMMVS